jgi:hypothetical protein
MELSGAGARARGQRRGVPRGFERRRRPGPGARHALDQLGEAGLPGGLEVQSRSSFGEAQVGVHARHDHAGVDREDLDPDERDPDVGVDDEPLVEDQADDV